MNNDFIDIFEREQYIYDSAVELGNGLADSELIPADVFTRLTKDYGRLLKQLRRVTKISDRATENLNSSKLELLDQVHFDVLTGVYNRRYLRETLKDNLHDVLQNKGCISVMMLDVDCFKLFNDTYGHSEGDQCLRMIASAIAESLTESKDYVARYGGEEFVVVLPDSFECVAEVIASRILSNVRALCIPHINNTAAPYVTISIGITTVSVEDGHTGEQYVNCADKALYVSKQNGKNRYTFLEFREEVKE